MAGGDANQSLGKQLFTMYSYVSIWISLSAAVILYNKWVLFFYRFPYPVALTMFHMAFCSSLAFICVKVLKWVEPLNMTTDQYIRQVVPIGALYAGSLWFSNSAYLYLSVSFIQMLKALMPVAVYCIGIMFKKEIFHSTVMANMVVISCGVAIASYGELDFNITGVIIQLSAIVAEAVRLVLVQILLTSQGVTMNPITSLYYISPACFVFLLVPFAFLELPSMRADETLHFNAFIFISNAMTAFLLNLAVYLLIGKTSALTMNVAGVVKDWLLIGLSFWIFGSPVTAINLAGYSLAFAAVCWYNYQKVQAMKAAEAAKVASVQLQAQEATDRTPLMQESGGAKS